MVSTRGTHSKAVLTSIHFIPEFASGGLASNQLKREGSVASSGVLTSTAVVKKEAA